MVTGSSGMLGRRTTRLLAERGHEVWGLDRRSAPESAPGPRQLVCDLLDARRVVDCLQQARPDAVIHLAARTDLDERQDITGYAANIDGVRHLVQAVRNTPGVTRVVYTSSQLVCKAGHVPADENEYCPNTLYGESKVETEKIVRETNGGGVPWCLVRPTTVWGPRMSTHYQRFFDLIRSGRYFHVGRRKIYKSFSYVGNIAHQYERLCTVALESVAGKTLYLADYEPVALQDWADGFARAFRAPRIRTYPRTLVRPLALAGDLINLCGWKRFPFNSFRLNNVLTETILDLAPTAEVCGPLPFGMQEGIAETAEWFLGLGRDGARSEQGSD